MNGKKNRCRLHAALFTMGDVVHPVPERVKVDASHSHAVRGDVKQSPEESLSWRLKINDDYRIELHTAFCALVSLRFQPLRHDAAWLEIHRLRLTFNDESGLCQSLYLFNVYAGAEFLQHESSVRNVDDAEFSDDVIDDFDAG